MKFITDTLKSIFGVGNANADERSDSDDSYSSQQRQLALMQQSSLSHRKTQKGSRQESSCVNPRHHHNQYRTKHQISKHHKAPKGLSKVLKLEQLAQTIDEKMHLRDNQRQKLADLEQELKNEFQVLKKVQGRPGSSSGARNPEDSSSESECTPEYMIESGKLVRNLKQLEYAERHFAHRRSKSDKRNNEDLMQIDTSSLKQHLQSDSDSPQSHSHSHSGDDNQEDILVIDHTQKREEHELEEEDSFDVEKMLLVYKDCSVDAILKDKELKDSQKLMRKVLFTPKRNTTAPAFEEISSFDQKRYNKRTTAAKGALEGKVGESEVAESFKFLCPLCLKLINKCMTTVCGHSFCERCIDEYTILKPTCFVCDFDGEKGMLVRNKPLRSCFTIDDMINQLVKNCKDTSLNSQWIKQQKKHLQWQKNKRLDNVQIDCQVDVRDKEYVWGIGTVRIVIESLQREPLLLIHFEGFPNQYDELIYQNSPRLAKFGTYTSRNDIPKYKFACAAGDASALKALPQIVNQLPSLLDTKSKQQTKAPPVDKQPSIILSDSQNFAPGELESSHHLPSNLVGGSTTHMEIPEEQQRQQLQVESDLQEQNVQDFFDQFEESNIERQRMQSWANQQVTQGPPIQLRNVIEGLSSSQNQQMSGTEMIDSLMGQQRTSSRQNRASTNATGASQVANGILNELLRYTDRISVAPPGRTSNRASSGRNRVTVITENRGNALAGSGNLGLLLPGSQLPPSAQFPPDAAFSRLPTSVSLSLEAPPFLSQSSAAQLNRDLGLGDPMSILRAQARNSLQNPRPQFSSAVDRLLRESNPNQNQNPAQASNSNQSSQNRAPEGGNSQNRE